jgi:hypothetical protein
MDDPADLVYNMDSKLRYSDDQPSPIIVEEQEASHIFARVPGDTDDKSVIYKNPNMANNLSQMNISHLTSNSQAFNGLAPGMVVEDQLAKTVFNFIASENDRDLLIFLKS